MKYEKLIKLSIRSHPELSERWVQERIAEDPSILGLGDVILKDKERFSRGPVGWNFFSKRRTAMAGMKSKLSSARPMSPTQSVPSSMDIERKRCPQYEHTAVIVAEAVSDIRT